MFFDREEEKVEKKRTESTWKILLVLALIGAAWTYYARDRWLEICILMALSYLNNCAYSMVSRSAVRDSATYHAFCMLLSNIVWYAVLHRLVLDNMSLFLFVPYTVATVWGSFTGAKASMCVEERLGITTDSKQKKESPRALLAKRILFSVMGVATIASVVAGKNLLLALTIIGMVFAADVGFSLLRRSRNTSNTTYHVVASLVYSAIWYALWGHLSLKGLPFLLFAPYCFGSVAGALFGQHASQWFERKIGATADKHLSDDAQKFSWKEIFDLLPWRVVATLALITIAFVAYSQHHYTLAMLTACSAGQQIAFSMVSRSRNRDNMTYHIIASIFSNGVWFLTFRQLQVQHWTPELYIPYAAGGAIGSVTGVASSMVIEKKLHITSEAKAIY
jgi:hypothetical protein